MNKSTIRPILGIAAVSLLLSACSFLGKDSIEGLQAICDGMRSRVVEIASNYPDRDTYHKAEWMASLSGESDRESLRQKILNLMPYLADYRITDYESGKFEQGLNDWRIKEAVLLMSQTPAPLEINEEVKQEILKADMDAYERVIKPKVEFYLGPSYRAEGETEANGCKELDDVAEPSIDYDNMVEHQWDYYGSQMFNYVRNYFWILSCMQTGKIEGDKCSGKKYVSTPGNPSGSSNKLTEEEKEILAEREADAERESQNPSGSVQTSNVTPGQICRNIGETVETENYGSLTCKLVFLKNIKALVWMRQ